MDISVLNAFKTAIINRITGAVNTHNSDTSSHSNKQDKSNITTSWGSILSDTRYPSEKLVKESIDNIKTEIQVIDDEEDATTDGIYLKVTRIPMELLISFENYRYGNEIGINIPTYTGDLIFDWGDGTSEVVSSSDDDYIYHEYEDTSKQYNIQIMGNITGICENNNTLIYYDEIDCLLQVTLPDTLITIGEEAFSSCPYLESVDIPNSVTTIGDYAFSMCTSLTSINIPNGVTPKIGSSTFYGTGLTSVDIPDSVTEIHTSAFYGCNDLESVSLGSGLTEIYATAFGECTSLTSIVIPSSVTTIGDEAFYECTSLVDYQLYWEGNTIITYDSDKMPNNTNTIFTIPNGQTSNYVAKGYPSAKLVERSA